MTYARAATGGNRERSRRAMARYGLASGSHEHLAGEKRRVSLGRSYTIRPMALIETSRLQLRPPAAADAEPFMDIFWDPEVVEKKQVTLTEAPGDLELARRKTAAL